MTTATLQTPNRDPYARIATLDDDVAAALADRFELRAADPRQYDLWRPNPLAEPGRFYGQTFLIVGAPARMVQHAFDEVQETTITYRENGRPLATWVVTVGKGYRGFPGVGHGEQY